MTIDGATLTPTPYQGLGTASVPSAPSSDDTTAQDTTAQDTTALAASPSAVVELSAQASRIAQGSAHHTKSHLHLHGGAGLQGDTEPQGAAGPEGAAGDLIRPHGNVGDYLH